MNRPGPSRANIELNREILECVSAGEVCACIEARADDFNYVNVATAFRKLLTARRGGVARSAMESATRKLEQSALRTMTDFDARGTANTMHIIAKTRYRPYDS